MSVDTEVSAGVMTALARYAHALDDGRTDDVIDQFSEGAVAEIPGFGRLQGHEALKNAYARLVPNRPQRHLVVNSVIGSTSDGHATVTSDFVLIVHEEGAWHTRVAGRYEDIMRRYGDRWLFDRRAMTLSPVQA